MVLKRATELSTALDGPITSPVPTPGVIEIVTELSEGSTDPTVIPVPALMPAIA